MSRKSSSDAVIKELREFGLTYPGAHLKSPWPGHKDLAVKDKTFAYLSIEGDPFGVSCKLPHSSATALMLPFTKPTAYGLGKSGWVSASFAEGESIPVDMLKEWIDESYRAQAPKKLVATLDAAASSGRGGGKGASEPKTKKAKTKVQHKPAAKPKPTPKKKAKLEPKARPESTRSRRSKRT